MNLRRFSVATFNLYNLQLPGEPMNRNQTPWTQEQYEHKLDWTARMLKRLDADVVGFQELWHADALEKLEPDKARELRSFWSGHLAVYGQYAAAVKIRQASQPVPARPPAAAASRSRETAAPSARFAGPAWSLPGVGHSTPRIGGRPRRSKVGCRPRPRPLSVLPAVG